MTHTYIYKNVNVSYMIQIYIIEHRLTSKLKFDNP